ncbi:MAG: hypothetical protein KC583_10070 [Myxococcales bacterium]|nr:hypothetical protein [Myxococcales bacterium]
MRRSYFLVEGPHDVEVVGRILRRGGLKRIRLEEELDDFWERLVPRKFPHAGDLLRRVPVPSFFADQERSVAVQSAGGFEKIPSHMTATLANLDGELEGVGVLVDADDTAVRPRWEKLANELPLPDVGAGPGEIGDGPPVAGVYVLPDNESSGALEHLLLACAEKAYPTLLAGARAWIDGIDPDDRDIFIDANERKWIKKPSGKPKAIAACIASVLRPGRALQVSIQDNRWLHDDGALDLEIVRRFRQFVERIAGL